jgi:hypothetical protein
MSSEKPGNQPPKRPVMKGATAADLRRQLDQPPIPMKGTRPEDFAKRFQDSIPTQGSTSEDRSREKDELNSEIEDYMAAEQGDYSEELRLTINYIVENINSNIFDTNLIKEQSIGVCYKISSFYNDELESKFEDQEINYFNENGVTNQNINSDLVNFLYSKLINDYTPFEQRLLQVGVLKEDLEDYVEFEKLKSITNKEEIEKILNIQYEDEIDYFKEVVEASHE